MRASSRTPVLLVAGLLAGSLLAGCSSGGSDDASSAEGGSFVAGDTGGEAVAPVDGAPLTGGSAGGGSTGGGSTGGVTDVDLRAVPGGAVLRTGELVVEVDDVRAAADAAARLAAAAGGRVDAEDRSGSGDDDSASLQLRLPPARFDALVTQLAELGEERSRRLSAEDVTEVVVDLEARLLTQRASVERVRALLDRAETIGEVVAVEAELTRRTADLEALQARLGALDDQLDLGTLLLTLLPVDDGPLAGGALGPLDGLRGGLDALTTTARLLGVALGAVAPFLPVVLAAVLLARWLRRRPGAAAG